MDAAVIASLAKWPQVPACHGWLAIDARGRWRLGAPDSEPREIVRHSGLAAFLGRNYACTAAGEWYCQNGPQRAYVDLECAPWVAHLQRTGNGCIATLHTGLEPRGLVAAHLGDDHRFYLVWEHGTAVVDDRDLPCLIDCLQDRATHLPCNDADIDALLSGQTPGPELDVCWQGKRLPLSLVACCDLPRRYGFVRQPRPAT